jgi:hypothetical protein
MEAYGEHLVLGGVTTRYLRLSIGAGWCYHPVFLYYYRVVLPPDMKGSSIGYFKWKISLFP